MDVFVSVNKMKIPDISRTSLWKCRNQNQPISGCHSPSSSLIGGEGWMTGMDNLRVHDLWHDCAEAQWAALCLLASALLCPAHTNTSE